MSSHIEENMPRYREALSSKNSRKVIQALAKRRGIAKFAEIEKLSGVKGSVLVYHLDRLQSLNVVEKQVKGTYSLTFKTPLCYMFNEIVDIPVAYLGLLGKKEVGRPPETEVALELLKKENINTNLVYVVTSPKALDDWKHLKLPYQWIMCYKEEIVDIDAVKRKVIPPLQSLLKNYIVIIDCTSATKPATIAYYELAQTYYTPLIYIYEETNELKWLISREKMMRKYAIRREAIHTKKKK